MPKRMLIDAGHPEETRVVVLDGNKVEEFDFESASKRPLKGNIYLAKVTRVEPSLQAAFVEYGGNRQGFLAFSEIHPDYYQIPVADRQALIEAQARRLMAEDEFDRVETAKAPSQETVAETAGRETEGDESEAAEARDELSEIEAEENEGGIEANGETVSASVAEDEDSVRTEAEQDENGDDSDREPGDGEPRDTAEAAPEWSDTAGAFKTGQETDSGVSTSLTESTGVPQPDIRRGERQERRDQRPPRPRRRNYKIQEVIKRRQIMLVQVVKEERGTKGASLTTYLSLAGRYCVLMPNTPRGGGISRKITSATDRKRLKSAAQGLELPEGMGLIIRTAGATRTKLEIKRDYEYLLRQWDAVRELTLKSNAPALVYEEGNLVKRVIRDLYGKDISEVLVEGDAGYRDAKDFMKMILPSHAKNVKPYKDGVPLFQKHHVEAQLDQMFSPTVTLKSGGYIVINQTEALVSIDVNSGKATREHSIEETAHKTNLEAADEIGRQLKLRDLAGLIVIDFIDMEDSRNDRNVEKRLHAATKNDRARVQIGKISQFGLLEMSRQRLRAGVIAGSTVTCPHCNGQGIIRSTESAALRLLRALDEEGQHQRASNLTVKAPPDVTIYTLNQKRSEIARIEQAYDLLITFEPQQTMMGGSFEIERTGTHVPSARPAPVSMTAGFREEAEPSEETAAAEEEDVTLAEPPQGTVIEVEPSAERQEGGGPSGQPGSGRRRRRRGGRGRGGGGQQAPQQHMPHHAREHAPQNGQPAETRLQDEGTGGTPQGQPGQPGQQQGGGGRRRRRRRGRGRHGQNGGPAIAPQAGGDGGPFPYDVSAEAGHEPAAPSEDMPTEPAHEPEGDAGETSPAVNAPSQPQWSFTPEAPREPAMPSPEPGVVEEAAPLDSIRPRPEPLPEAPTPEQKRAGWWQRRFKSGA